MLLLLRLLVKLMLPLIFFDILGRHASTITIDKHDILGCELKYGSALGTIKKFLGGGVMLAGGGRELVHLASALSGRVEVVDCV